MLKIYNIYAYSGSKYCIFLLSPSLGGCGLKSNGEGAYTIPAGVTLLGRVWIEINLTRLLYCVQAVTHQDFH